MADKPDPELTPPPSAASVLIVNGPFKLIGRGDGSIALEADVPGDGKGASRMDVPASYASAFLRFLGASSSAARALVPPPAID